MPRASLIIATYNNPRYLDLVLRSVRTQTARDFETIIADNGSDTETVALVRRHAADFPVPLKHYTQHHRPYWLGQARNGAILASSGETIINIDGDIILHPRFVESHLALAGENRLLFGGRLKLSQAFSETLTPESIANPGMETLVKKASAAARETQYAPMYESGWDRLSGYLTQRICGRYWPLPNAWALGRAGVLPRSLQRFLCLKSGCNWSTSRALIERVNGFDERFGLGGGEDGEFFWRVTHAGAMLVSVLSSAVAYHLYHGQGWQREGELRTQSKQWERETIASRRIRCERGLAEHDYGWLVEG
jgi:glycosyltransferase involved in cell wall biosynthesis